MVKATIFEAKTNLSELVKKAQNGETVIITSGRDKKPVAKLEAIKPIPKKRLGVMGDTRIRDPRLFLAASSRGRTVSLERRGRRRLLNESSARHPYPSVGDSLPTLLEQTRSGNHRQPLKRYIRFRSIGMGDCDESASWQA